jgi:hypothetical protein
MTRGGAVGGRKPEPREGRFGQFVKVWVIGAASVFLAIALFYIFNLIYSTGSIFFTR